MNDIYARTNNICLVFLTIVTATISLIYMKPVLIPLTFSIFAYAILTPLVSKIQKKMNLPKGLAIFVSMVGLFLALTLIVLILVNSVGSFIDAIPKYKDSLAELTATILSFVSVILHAFDINLDIDRFSALVKKLPLFSWAQSLGGSVFSFLGNLFLVFIFSIFMMTGESRSQQKSPMVKELLGKVSSYISTKFFLSLATALLVWIILLFFGVELAVIFALLTFLLNFIPTIGSILAVALPLPMVLLQYQFDWPFFVILALTGTIQFTIGNVIEPKVMGDSMDLHPITVLMCLIFWGMVWKVPGMFLAVPITAVLKIIFSKIEATRGLAEIMAGRFPDRV